MTGQYESYPKCPNDNFPMVRIGGKLQCVAEALDRCLGGKRVTGVVVRGETGYYVFEDGHELPLLCACCGEPLHVFDVEQSQRNIVGRRLEGMGVMPVELEDGNLLEEFSLQFSKRGLFSKVRYDALSPEVAANLRHPEGCSHRWQRLTSSRKRRRKRR